jgi:hypothetical protein
MEALGDRAALGGMLARRNRAEFSACRWSNFASLLTPDNRGASHAGQVPARRLRRGPSDLCCSRWQPLELPGRRHGRGRGAYSGGQHAQR